MRINFKYFLWMPLSVLLLGFPVVSKAGTPDGFFKAKSASKSSIVLVDDHRGRDRGRDRDRGRWGDRDDWRGDRHWNHERWEHRGRRDRYYVYPYGSYGYYPYYGYGYAPYTYAYPYNYSYPYYSYPRGNTVIGGFLNLW